MNNLFVKGPSGFTVECYKPQQRDIAARNPAAGNVAQRHTC